MGLSKLRRIKVESMQYINSNIEQIKSIVGRYFPFYDVREGTNSIIFFCRIDEERLERDFELLRVDLSHYNYIPILRYEGGENIIHVVPKPKRKEVSLWVNWILLIATVITTTLTGALLVSGKTTIWGVSDFSMVFNIDTLSMGFLLFSLPLLTILGVHEMGHYYVSKMHGIRTSLPYFIPVPPILGFNIGTFGALISSRDPLSNRKILFDVGISGPLAGFVVALPITLLGVLTSPLVRLDAITKGGASLGFSLFFYILHILLVPKGYTISLNPVAFAGWVGLLVTSINLLPAGQLDGGHIARAVLGEKQKYLGWIAVLILLFTDWLFFAFLILFVIGVTHPPPLNDFSPIDNKRKALFIVSTAILILCFVPTPILLT